MPRIRWSDWSVICLLLAMLLAGSPPLALSQAPVPLSAGARVRLKPVGPSTKSVQGNLLRLSEDSLHILPAGGADTVAFATGAVARLEVSRGRRSNAGKGALLGLAIGAGAGLALGVAASAEECTGLGCTEVGPGEVVAVMAFFGATGAGLGALIGAASHSERWEQVPRPWVSAQLHRSRGVVVGVVMSW
jgi:hypothetical protein